MKKTTCLIITLLITSVSALASNLKTMAPPQPIDNTISESAMLDLFSKGTTTTEESLMGTWNWIATSNSNGCQFSDDITDWSGIKNKDNSLTQFVFTKTQINIPGANPTENVFTVTIKNLGSMGVNQGPYHTNATSPQFSLWVYDTYGKITKLAYAEYSCRLVRNTTDQLICQSQLFITDRKANIPDAALACSDQKYSGHVYLKKSQD